MGFVRQREAVGKAGWNPALRGKEQTIEDLKFANYYKEVYLDSDTKVALISGAPSEIPQDWFLTNEMKAEARTRVNKDAGSRRMLSHAIFTPGYPGWMEQVDHATRELKPDSFKGYTIGDNTNKNVSKHPWRMDDDKLVYPFYEKQHGFKPPGAAAARRWRPPWSTSATRMAAMATAMPVSDRPESPDADPLQKRRRPPSARLRRRSDFGVTSSSSSSRIHSRHCSRFMMRGGVSRMLSSADEARMLVSFFSLVMFTSRSLSREFSPTIWPSYTNSPGFTNIVPRAWRLSMA